MAPSGLPQASPLPQSDGILGIAARLLRSRADDFGHADLHRAVRCLRCHLRLHVEKNVSPLKKRQPRGGRGPSPFFCLGLLVGGVGVENRFPEGWVGRQGGFPAGWVGNLL